MQPNSNNSSVNKKLLNLDIIRAVAAVMIVLVHLELFGWGGHGVELFLLLTGYTAFLSIDRHKDVSPLSYYKRRLARILPSYYGVVLIYFFHLSGCAWREVSGEADSGEPCKIFHAHNHLLSA